MINEEKSEATVWRELTELSLSAYQRDGADHYVPENKHVRSGWFECLTETGNRKVYRDKELFTIGMPCGGVASGQVYVRGDGTLGRFYPFYDNHHQNTNTDWATEDYALKGRYPYGYRTVRPEANIDQGFLIVIKRKSSIRTQELMLSEEGFGNIGFIGEYPIATVLYEGAREYDFPAAITAEIFSPFIPLNTRDSANPAVIFRHTVANTSNEEINVKLAGWLQNAAMLESSPNINAKRRNNVVKDGSSVSVFMDLTSDEEAKGPESDCRNTQFGNMTISVLDEDGYAAARMLSRQGKEAASEYQLVRDLYYNIEKYGKLGPEEMICPIAQKANGITASSFNLSPGETRTVTFVISWYFPNYNNHYPGCPGEVGRMYANFYDSSLGVVQYMSENIDRLYQETKRFRDTFFDTSLPYWFIQRAGMPVSILATNTVEWWKNGRFYSMEGVGFCFGTCGHVWNYVQAVARLFPQFEKSVRLDQDIALGLRQNGRVNFRGYKDTVTDEDDLEKALHQWYYAADAQCGYILKFYREHLMSSSNDFLYQVWPNVKRMMEYLIDQDGQDGKVDGMIEVAQHNTSDGFLFGPNTFTGSLYLAALRACEEMAKIMGEEKLAEYYHQIFISGREYALEKLWNGEYFINIFPEAASNKFCAIGYNDGCHIDQLFGQTWAHQLGLGYLYPEEHVKSAMKSLFKYNWTPDHKEAYADENRSRAMGSQAYPGDAGMLTVTYPKTKKGDKRPNYWYSDFTWSGFEYSAAALMFSSGLLKEGLAVYRGIHERYDGNKHNPWNEIEGGDHYTRAMASWAGLIGISGYIYDGPAGLIGFSPAITPDDFKCFFSAAEGWGSLVQKRFKDSQVNKIQMKWGKITIQKIILELPEGKTVSDYALKVSDSALIAAIKTEKMKTAVCLSQSVTLEAGKELEIYLDYHNGEELSATLN